MTINDEILKIQPAFDNVIATTQLFSIHGQEIMNTTPLLTEWAKNKERFYKMFGNSCIYEVPEAYEGQLNPDLQEQLFYDFIRFVKNNSQQPKKVKAFITFLQDLTFKEFFNNKLDYDYYVDIDNKTIIKKTTKTIKAFKYFFNENEKDLLHIYQQKASEAVQANKITGKLCLSIHPLDFLTLSENNHNWRSCHALDGEYAGGNLDYLTDSATIIAYLKSDKEEVLHNVSRLVWNSKKWRMLFHFDQNNEFIFINKQYPFSNESLFYSAWKVIKNNLGTNKCFSVQHTYDCLSNSMNNNQKWFIPRAAYQSDDHKMVKLEDILILKEDPLHYNDLLWSTSYTPSYFKQIQVKEEDCRIQIGGITKCAICGQNDIVTPDLFVCKECAGKHTYKIPEGCSACDRCGRIIDHEHGDSYVEVGDDSIYCEECARQLEEMEE